jgi:putative solute:sodium symporter small subunit
MPTDQRAQRPLPPSLPLSPLSTPGASTAPAVDDAGAAAQRQLALLAARARHWQRTRRLTFVLLALWLAASFCSVFFARELAGLSLFGWPLSFYLAAQGAALIYLAILGAYAAGMRRFDRRYGRELGQTAPGDAP